MLGPLHGNYLTSTFFLVGLFMSSLKSPDCGMRSSSSFTVSAVGRNLMVSFQLPSAEIVLPPQQVLSGRWRTSGPHACSPCPTLRGYLIPSQMQASPLSLSYQSHMNFLGMHQSHEGQLSKRVIEAHSLWAGGEDCSSTPCPHPTWVAVEMPTSFFQSTLFTNPSTCSTCPFMICLIWFRGSVVVELVSKVFCCKLCRW